MGYIIGIYDKYDTWDRKHTKYVFEVNGQVFGVKEVELEWGTPILPQYVDRDENADTYWVYGSMEDAMRFVQQVRRLN